MIKDFKYLAILLIFCPAFVWAVSTSENYQFDGDFDNGGNFSNSENYQSYDSVSGESPMTTSAGGSQVTEVANNQENSIQTVINKITSTVSDVVELLSSNGVVEAITTNDTIEQNKTSLATAVAVLTGAVATIPLAANLPLAYSFGNIFPSVFPFFGRRKKSQKWGIVYDGESRQAINQAIVRIYNPETKKVLETQITDNAGRFDLVIAPGQYYLEVFKESYSFPSKLIGSDYHGETIKVEEGEVLELNIPMDPKLNQLASRVKKIWRLRAILEFLYYPLLFIGTCLAIVFYLKYQDTNNLLVIILYFVILFYELYKHQGSRPFGLVFDNANKSPLELAIVRVFDNEKGKLVTTKVTDPKGKFVFLVNRGQYYLFVVKQGYDQFKSEMLEFKGSAAINIDVPLKKN